MEDRVVLQTMDYIVITAMLVIPLGIGIFFAIRDAKKTTRDEYLLGGRRMAMVPVTLSIFVTFQSAISLIGMPSEIYQYGPLYAGFYIGVGFSFLIAYLTVAPLMYPLQLTSIYEYLERRYESQAVRLMSTVLGMLQTFFYMAVALLAPGLALEAAAGIPLWLSVVIVGATGTIYTSAGGIKSVVWTDAFQTTVVFVGIITVMIKSCNDIGGVQKSWDIVDRGGRTNFNEFTIDPRVRHTFWSTIIGGTFTWLTNLFGQSTVQRITSLKSLKDARTAMLINVPLNALYGLVLTVLGWFMYAYFSHIRCDPYKAGLINNPNQMTPYFVLHAMHEIPGIAGLYMAALFSGALSTVSSGINALAANTVEDLLRKPLKSVSEKTATTITKIAVLCYGAAIMIMVYLSKSFKGPVTQMAISVFGTFGSSILGIFLIGCCVPWANKYGAISGGLISLFLNLWIIIGSNLRGKPAPRLDPAPIDQCFNTTELSSLTSMIINLTETSTQSCTICGSDENTFFLYDISYEWISVIGGFVCVVVGLIISRITRHKAQTKTDPKLIIPILRKFWGLSEPIFELYKTSEDCDYMNNIQATEI